MKKIIAACLILGLCVSSGFAITGGVIPYGVGAKFAAMGGAGSTLVDDTAAAYYNPAGITRSQALGLKLGVGYAIDGTDKIMSVLSSVSNPSKFLADNYSNALNLNGSMNGLLGINIAKQGISVIPATNLTLTKPASTLGGSIAAMLLAEAAYTAGMGLSLPFVGGVAVGANIKYINAINGTTSVGVAGPVTTDMTDSVSTYAGMGYDIGIMGDIDAIPMAPINVGIVLKDLGATLNGSAKTTKSTFNNLTGSMVGSPVTLTDGPIAGYVMPTTTVIGASTSVPMIGLKVAFDLDNVSGGTAAQTYSVTHLGVEYPVLGIAALRAGTISGGPAGSPISMTTFGAGILGSMINVAMITDNNNPKNNQFMFDIGLGL